VIADIWLLARFEPQRISGAIRIGPLVPRLEVSA
jgi:hypothetical protein